jgi:hypothetical protein
LIVYYSHSSNNQLLANELKRRLDCEILRIEDQGKRTRLTIFLDLLFKRRPRIKKYSQDISVYDHVILVGPIWASGIATPLKTFLLQEHSNLDSYSFITVCGGRPGQKQLIAAELAHYARQEPEKIGEIWISKLVPEDKQKDLKYMMAYKFGPDDMQKVSSIIDEFVDSLMPEMAR